MARAIGMKMLINFPLKEGEAENDAIDRLHAALATGVPGCVMSWEKPEIEEYEDDGPDDEESMKALQEAEDIIAGRVEAKEYDTFAECVKDIVNEVEPIKNGSWVLEKKRERHWHCSCCGMVWGVTVKCMNYCPGCGAKMRKEE